MSVPQLKVRQLWAEVEYTRTGEVEQLDLGELISEGQIAVGEQIRKFIDSHIRKVEV